MLNKFKILRGVLLCSTMIGFSDLTAMEKITIISVDEYEDNAGAKKISEIPEVNEVIEQSIEYVEQKYLALLEENKQIHQGKMLKILDEVKRLSGLLEQLGTVMSENENLRLENEQLKSQISAQQPISVMLGSQDSARQLLQPKPSEQGPGDHGLGEQGLGRLAPGQPPKHSFFCCFGKKH